MKVFRVRDFRGHSRFLLAREISEFYDDQVKKLKSVLPRFTGRSHIQVAGTVLIQLFNPDRELTDVRMGFNLVVDAGKAAVIDRLQAGAVAVHDYQAIGTGTAAAAAGDTTLVTEIGARVQGVLTQPTALTDRLVSTFAAGNGTGAITETGRFNAAAAGNLFARQVFAAVNKTASDSLQITHDITVS